SSVFTQPAPPSSFTLSLHDALPILGIDRAADPLDHLGARAVGVLGGLDLLAEDDVHGALGAHHRDLGGRPRHDQVGLVRLAAHQDRKSTRLNSSHSQISYAVFCLKK